VSKRQNTIEQQIYLSEQQADLNIPKNSHRYVQLYLQGESCEFAGTLNKNARAKVFIVVDNWRNC
jgi:hypothetical protein